MVILAYSLVQHCFGVAVVVVGTVDEEVGYEEIDFLDGSSSTQETKKLVGLIVGVPMVTKS